MRRLIACLAAVAPLACAQTNPAPQFEVAVVRPVDPKAPIFSEVRIYPGGRLVVPGTLKDLVMIAFHLSYRQISGGDPWTEHENYTVEAKPPDSLRPPLTNLRHSWWDISDPRLREMLQALLIDRFLLKSHKETKTGPVYLLEKGDKKLKLIPTDPKRWPANSTGDTRLSEVDLVNERFYVINESLPQLPKFAADYVLHAPVLDRTDLSGSFDYTEPPPLEERDPATIDFAEAFKGMIHDIGLKLVRTEGPVEMFVIDHAAKPSAN